MQLMDISRKWSRSGRIYGQLELTGKFADPFNELAC